MRLPPPQPSLRSRGRSPRPAWSRVLARVAGRELQNYPGELGSPGGFENLGLRSWESNLPLCTGHVRDLDFIPAPPRAAEQRGVRGLPALLLLLPAPADLRLAVPKAFCSPSGARAAALVPGTWLLNCGSGPLWRGCKGQGTRSRKTEMARKKAKFCS